MMAGCPAIAPGEPFLGSAIGYLDCQAQAIGSGGYAALAAAGSTGAVVLTGALTLFVALFGYRLLVGETPASQDGVLAIVKIGVVLALATSWPAYRTLVYDVALRAPAELGATVGRSAGLPGAGGGLVAWLQAADDGYVLLGTLGTEATIRADQPSPVPTPLPQPGASPQPRPNPGFDALMLNLARIVYLVGALGALASVRLVAGLLLALGPIFAVFLLFDGTRGLFEGWVRGLAGAALGAFGAALVLGVELAFVEPWLVALIAEREAGRSISGVPVELFVLALVFALALIATLIAAARVAYGFHLPRAMLAWPARWLADAAPTRVAADGAPRAATARAAEERSRAHAIADAVAATQRRENAPGPAAVAIVQRAPAAPRAGRDPGLAAPVPIGQSFRRRTRGRISAGAGRRDGRT